MPDRSVDLTARTLGARLAAAPGRWSVAIVDRDGDDVFAYQPDVMLRTASSAKLLVLVAAAFAIEDGRLDPAEPLSRRRVAPVADSGLWQHLRVESLAVDDVARLIGSVSDNLATNALIDRLGGVDVVGRVAAEHGVDGIRLLDIVRDERTAEHAETLSQGCARGYATFFHRLSRGAVGSPFVSESVWRWLRDGVDLGMVADAFGLDPLAHSAADRGISLWHKTGADTGVRADSGLVVAGDASVAYSCLVEFDDADRDEVREVMRAVGGEIRRLID